MQEQVIRRIAVVLLAMLVALGMSLSATAGAHSAAKMAAGPQHCAGMPMPCGGKGDGCMMKACDHGCLSSCAVALPELVALPWFRRSELPCSRREEMAEFSQPPDPYPPKA
jgi:hypothetical protein